MKIAITANQTGKQAAEAAKSIIIELGHECIDMCRNSFPDDDYPDLAYMAARAVTNNEVDRAILICGSGICMSIAANKVPGIVAVPCYDAIAAVIARSSFDSNVLCLSSKWFEKDVAGLIIHEWLDTAFSGTKRQQRILQKIQAIERGTDPHQITGT